MRCVRPLGAALAGAMAGAVLFACPAAAASSSHAYRVLGLPSYITEPTAFTVDPEEALQICAMHFGETTLTEPPWTFTAVPPEDGEDLDEVEVEPCSGAADTVPVTISGPVVFRTAAIFPDGLRESTLRITNNTDRPLDVDLLSPSGVEVANFEVPGARADSVVSELTVPTSVVEGLRETEKFTLRAVGDGGVVAYAPLIIAKGWALFPDEDASVPARIAPCSTVSWSYDRSAEPRRARTFAHDVAEAFSRLGAITGLHFVRHGVRRDDAAIRIGWSDLGVGGPSGLGGTDGRVSFNTKDRWPTDLYAGFSAEHGSPADRGWLILHEVMHTLGFDHVPGRQSIMTPINYGQHRFSKGDLAGLRTRYPKAGCPR